jgi:hypothetical protein
MGRKELVTEFRKFVALADAECPNTRAMQRVRDKFGAFVIENRQALLGMLEGEDQS